MAGMPSQLPGSTTIRRHYKNIPVAITNDANAAAIGEKKFGAAKSMEHAVVITLGTGLGSGLIINNNIFIRGTKLCTHSTPILYYYHITIIQLENLRLLKSLSYISFNM